MPVAVSDWTETDVGTFLDNIGLHEYSPMFVHERVRGVTLADLNVQDAMDLGVQRLGDRKFLFKVRSDEERSDSKSIIPPSYIIRKLPLVPHPNPLRDSLRFAHCRPLSTFSRRTKPTTPPMSP